MPETRQLTTAEQAFRAAEYAADRRAAHVPQISLTMGQILDRRWAQAAACTRPAVNPDDFVPDPGAGQNVSIIRAQEVCATCPFIRPCRDYRYVTGSSGVWAGVYYPTSSAGVKLTHRKCKLMACPVTVYTTNPYHSYECAHKATRGTMEGYLLHGTAKTPVCPSCKTAKSNQATRQSSHILVG